MEIGREIRRGGGGPVAPLSYLPEHITQKPLVTDAEITGRAYLRLTVLDRADVVGQVTGALGDEGVGIASVVQRGQSGGSAGTASLVVLTHSASEAALRAALEKIEALSGVTEAPRVIRIEEEV